LVSGFGSARRTEQNADREYLSCSHKIAYFADFAPLIMDGSLLASLAHEGTSPHRMKVNSRDRPTGFAT
jgi:hypothetical protein